MTIAPGYDGRDAQLCALVSRIVYALPYQIRRTLRSTWVAPRIALRSMPKGNSRTLVVDTGTAVYVVFRGTVMNSVKSWMVNLSTLRRRWFGGKVHRGFSGVLTRAKPFFGPKLAGAGARPKEIYFTGHSQGGAVAFLAAMDGTRPGRSARFAMTYSFGQPRAGNARFCRQAERRLAGRCRRIVNKNDVVVGVPLVVQGYDHVRDYLHYDRNGSVARRRQGAGWWGFSASDHSMTGYLKIANKNSNVVL